MYSAALLCAQRSVNAAQQEDSGICWGSVKAVDVFRGFEMFVLEAFNDNRSLFITPDLHVFSLKGVILTG